MLRHRGCHRQQIRTGNSLGEMKGGQKMKKFNFKKITALAGSLLMAGATMGLAAAASYPAPFVSGSSANVAIVYGTGTGVSSLDLIQAGNLQADLQAYLGTDSTNSGSTVTGGDSYKFEKTSTKFHLGDNITQVISSSVDDDELPTLLADGKYVDNDNDEFDYTQKIDIGANLQLGMFEDNDYAEDQPTIGFRVASGTAVLTYTLDFSDEPVIGDLPTSDLPIMGKSYYVLSNSTSGSNIILTLLDSADSTILTEGESATVDGKEVVITYISSTEVKLQVDGQTTNSLAEGQTQKLTDGSYVGVKDILYDAKDTGVSKVEFSIGTGKLTLTSGSDIQMNDESVSGINVTITNSTDSLSDIKISWLADDDLFITEDSEIEMPGFEAVKLSFGGLTYPSEETVTIQQGGDTYAVLDNFPLKDGEADINLLYGASGAFTGLGKDANNKLVTAATGSTFTFDGDTDDYFVASWSDGSDGESYLMRATNFVVDGSDNKTTFQYYKDGSWVDTKTGAKEGDTFSLGSVEIVVDVVNKTDKTVLLGNNSANTNFNTLYSKTGLKVFLPYEATNATIVTGAPGSINFTAVTTGVGGDLGLGHNATSFYLTMVEEDKDDNVASGDTINATIGWDSSTTQEVEVSTYTTTNTDATKTEIGDTDVWRDFTYSALATEILSNEPSSGQKSLKVVYHGGEVSADVYITSPDATVTTTTTGAGSLGDVLVKDTEVSSVSTKNLIVVGGSCINSAAASLVGGAYCGAMFTEQTGVGSGQFVIKGYSDSTITSKMALLVAGYEAADTVNAATYLRTQKPDTSQAWVGTSSSSATLQVA